MFAVGAAAAACDACAAVGATAVCDASEPSVAVGAASVFDASETTVLLLALLRVMQVYCWCCCCALCLCCCNCWSVVAAITAAEKYAVSAMTIPMSVYTKLTHQLVTWKAITRYMLT